MSQTNSSNNDPSKQPASNEPSLRQRMSQDLQLHGMAKRTHDGYLREVRKLAAYYNTPPYQLTEQQVGEYLLYLINDCEFAPGSLGVAYSGIKFFYTVTEPRDWNVLRKLRRPKQKTLPAALTRDEVHQLIAAIKQYRNVAYCRHSLKTGDHRPVSSAYGLAPPTCHTTVQGCMKQVVVKLVSKRKS